MGILSAIVQVQPALRCALHFFLLGLQSQRVKIEFEENIYTLEEMHLVAVFRQKNYMMGSC